MKSVKEINPFTSSPYSEDYYKLKEQREKLEIYKYNDQLIDLISKHHITIVESLPGSGKTTQIPQIILKSKLFDDHKQIICTEPRRSIAINAAKRVSKEIDVEFGEIVGFHIHFDSNDKHTTKIVYMTDGNFLREFASDPKLEKYSVVVIDEIQERTVNIDIILSLIMLNRNSISPKIVLLSSKQEGVKIYNILKKEGLDTALLKMKEELKPVNITYYAENVQENFQNVIELVCKLVKKNDKSGILVYAPSEESISVIHNCLQKILKSTPNDIPNYEIHPFFSSIPVELQERVISNTNSNSVNIIIASSFSESIFTFSNIRYVIDMGLNLKCKYLPKIHTFEVQTSPISKVSADLRANSAGRVENGECYRFYTENTYNSQLPLENIPEVHSINLAQLIIELYKVGIRNIKEFPFIEPLDRSIFELAISELKKLEVLNNNEDLTEIGEKILKLPLPIHLARTLILSNKYNCTNEIAILASLLNETNHLFEKPFNDEAYKSFKGKTGDHIMYINAYQQFVNVSSDKKQWCLENHLNYDILIQAERLHKDLKNILNDLNIGTKELAIDNPKREENILSALVEGLFQNIALKKPNAEEFTIMNSDEKVCIHPNSSLNNVQCQYVLYNNLNLSNKKYIETVSMMSNEFLLKIKPDIFGSEGI